MNSSMNKKINQLKSKKGFNLIEIMIVVGLIGTLMVIAFSSLGGVGDKGKERMSRVMMKQIKSSAELYYAQEGKRPKSLEDLVTAEVLEEDKLTDAFGVDFEAEFSGRKIIIRSAGINGEFGDEDDLSSEKSQDEEE